MPKFHETERWTANSNSEQPLTTGQQQLSSAQQPQAPAEPPSHPRQGLPTKQEHSWDAATKVRNVSMGQAWGQDGGDRK